VGPFKVFRGKLTLDGEGRQLHEHPSLVLRLFRTAEEENIPLYSWARDQVAGALKPLADARGAPEVVSELKALFARPGTRGESVAQMHELGALGAVLPEFGRITAHHQHDLYHVYTVDVHTLFALKRLYALRAGDYVSEQPELSREMRELQDPLPLYLGMLLHDCGKGMGGDHSKKGAVLCAHVGERWGLTPRQKEIAEFLVLEHLTMSHVAQRRDLSDPDLIAEFAKLCGDAEKLACLYLLTWADISSVAPKMWNDWKAQLLSELFEKTQAHLLGAPFDEGGLLAMSRQRFGVRWRKAFGEERARALDAALPDRYFLSTEPSSATLHGRVLRRLEGGRRQVLAAALRHRRDSGFTELSLSAKDRPGLLALFTGVLAAHRIDILRARIASTADGRALDVFDVQAPQAKPLERSRWRAARADLIRALAGEISVEQLLEKRRQSSLLARALPKVEPKVVIDNRSSQRFTVVDVRAQDRVGLLHAIASALTASGLAISLAKVATEAHRAIDSFYVTRDGKKVTDPQEVSALTTNLYAALAALQARA
jgi:[protein-PII] uridylyltransferase